MGQRVCSIDECGQKHLARGWCKLHYTRWREHGDPGWTPEPPSPIECGVAGCGDPAKARGLCSHHVERFYRYGDPCAIPPRVARAQAIVEAGEKACSACGVTQPLGDFYAASARLTGTGAKCKRCSDSRNRDYRAANVQAMREAKNRYRASLPPDRRARELAAVARWKKANRDAVRRSNEKRRALKAGCSVAEIDVEAIWARTQGRCALCNYGLSRETMWPDERFASLDHIVPLAKGGAHATENLQYACLVCNLRKGTRLNTSADSPAKR